MYFGMSRNEEARSFIRSRRQVGEDQLRLSYRSRQYSYCREWLFYVGAQGRVFGISWERGNEAVNRYRDVNR